MKILNKLIPSFVICALVIGHYSFASAKEYDGTWFLGFNLRKAPFNNLQARQAVAHGLGREEEAANFVPPGMPGYDPELHPYKYNLKYARKLFKKPYKDLTLLHTDGVRTIAIAKKIQSDLKQAGVKIDLVQVSFRNEENWRRELLSGKYNLFLMGYKANIEQLYTEEAVAAAPETASLLGPLFKTGGEANFTGFSNSQVDLLLDQLSVIGPALAKERELKLKEINKILYKELPAVVLFYIEKL